MTTSDANDAIELQSSGMRARVAIHGAQLQSLATNDGLDILWHGDPQFWPEHAPILFPLIGPLPDDELRHRGKTYTLPPHGFAKDREFTVLERSDNRCVLALTDDDATREMYPFAFRLEVEYALRDSGLDHTMTVFNTGGETLPCDVGFHPGFRWPLSPGRPKEDYRITFEQEEPAPIRRGAGDPILLYPEPFPTPVQGNDLPLTDDLFVDQAMVFDQLNSRSVTYDASDGPRLRVDFPDSPDMALWMRPGATFIAIEPWQGLPAELGFDGDFEDKPDIARIAPGSSQSWRLRVTLDG